MRRARDWAWSSDNALHGALSIAPASCRLRARASQTDPEPVACGVGQVELGAEVALGGLDVLVAKRKLDLLERCLAAAGELGKGAAQIVWRQVPTEWPRGGGNDVGDGVGGHPRHPCLSVHG